MLIRNTTRGRVLARRAWRARTPWARARGLLGRRDLAPGEGLHLSPCAAVHTCFMRFAIDVLFLDARGVVVRSVPELRPWRFTRPVRGARGTVELPAGTLALTGTRPGDRVVFEDVTGAAAVPDP